MDDIEFTSDLTKLPNDDQYLKHTRHAVTIFLYYSFLFRCSRMLLVMQQYWQILYLTLLFKSPTVIKPWWKKAHLYENILEVDILLAL